MKVGLFIPCYVDQLYPDVAISTVEVLETLGVNVDFPSQQTCCGQPMANTGCVDAARPLAERFLEIFSPYDFVVCPSGSCTAMVRYHYHDFFGDDPRYKALKQKTFDLCEFLHDVVSVASFPTAFPYRVGLHQACHGLRELRLGWSSETMSAREDKVSRLLKRVPSIELAELKRPDECCGFGGTFAVNEAAVSTAMGQDRIADHETAGAQIIAAGDMSCLMHLEGLIKRAGKPMTVMHVAQIFAGRQPQHSNISSRPPAIVKMGSAP